MALVFVEPTPSVRRSFERGLEDLTGAPPPDGSAVHVPVVTYSVEALVRGASLADESRSGCRFYAGYATPPGVIASEMTNPSDYGKADFRSLLEGERAERGWARIAQLAALDEVANVNMLLHVISIPSLFVDAFLLRAEDGGTPDQVAPLDLLADALEPPVLQSLEAFLAALQPVAAARLAPVDDPLLP
jgi:hypothetical protein